MRLPSNPTCVTATVAAVVLMVGPTRTASGQEMTFEQYQPRSTLVVPTTAVTRARFPFVDIHNHQRSLTATQVDGIVREMDALNMAVMINLSGGTGERLQQTVQTLKSRYPNRFVVFANLDYTGIDDPRWSELAAARLERDVREGGAQGLKIFKTLGLELRDGKGRRIATDDPRFDAVWRKAGELGIPVLIHTGEPASFFDEGNEFNERWLELKEFPNRARPSSRYPSWAQVMAEQHGVFRKHPGTTFVNAHLGWMGNDLAKLGKLLDENPNVYTEIAAVIAELGRQPRFARDWFIRYQDRVLFGKDTWAPEEYHTYFRVLESRDEYFDYFRRRHAFWKMYGLDLPPEVLRKLYYENALKILPGLDASLFR